MPGGLFLRFACVTVFGRTAARQSRFGEGPAPVASSCFQKDWRWAIVRTSSLLLIGLKCQIKSAPRALKSRRSGTFNQDGANV